MVESDEPGTGEFGGMRGGSVLISWREQPPKGRGWEVPVPFPNLLFVRKLGDSFKNSQTGEGFLILGGGRDPLAWFRELTPHLPA